MNAELLLTIVVLAQLLCIYGLINRLMRQSGQRGMGATELLKQAEKLIVESTPADDKPREQLQRFGRKLGSVSVSPPLPDNYGKPPAEVKK